MKTLENMINKYFDQFMESYENEWSQENKDQQATFYEYQESIKTGTADPEALSDVQYTALKAGYYEGFKMAVLIAAGMVRE